MDRRSPNGKRVSRGLPRGNGRWRDSGAGGEGEPAAEGVVAALRVTLLRESQRRAAAERRATSLSEELDLASARFQSQIALLSDALATREEAEQRRRELIAQRRAERREREQFDREQQQAKEEAAQGAGVAPSLSGVLGSTLGQVRSVASTVGGIASNVTSSATQQLGLERAAGLLSADSKAAAAT